MLSRWTAILCLPPVMSSCTGRIMVASKLPDWGIYGSTARTASIKHVDSLKVDRAPHGGDYSYHTTARTASIKNETCRVGRGGNMRQRGRPQTFMTNVGTSVAAVSIGLTRFRVCHVGRSWSYLFAICLSMLSLQPQPFLRISIGRKVRPQGHGWRPRCSQSEEV
jgi:hypothetical protein